MNHPRRPRDYAENDKASLASTETILVETTTHSSPRLHFVGAPVSPAASLPSVSSGGTKLDLERRTSKITSVATRASARVQTRRGRSFSSGARVKERKLFRYPNRPISCIQPPETGVVGPKKKHNLQLGYETSSPSCAILPIEKAWPMQNLCKGGLELHTAKSFRVYSFCYL
jgi:hypothetical protein